MWLNDTACDYMYHQDSSAGPHLGGRRYDERLVGAEAGSVVWIQAHTIPDRHNIDP